MDKFVKLDFIPIAKSQQIVLNCASFSIWNKGTQVCSVNGTSFFLNPGEWFTFDLYPGEMINQNFQFTFTNDRLPGCYCVVIAKTLPLTPNVR